MTEKKKKPWFAIASSYVGELIILIAGIRLYVLTKDDLDFGLIVLGLIIIPSYFNAAESKWDLTKKEKYIINGSLAVCLIIILAVSFCFI